jgi:hypothetical protein
METLLARLELANPGGLASLRKRFGDDDEGNVFGLRTELVLGYHLATAGVPFRFGDEGEPDFCCQGNPEIWIEARMRGRDDIRLLLIEMKQALAGLSVAVSVNMARRLAISASDRSTTIGRIVSALGGKVPSGPLTIHLPEVNGTASVEPSPWGSPSTTFGATSSALGPHLSEVEREIGNVVIEKTNQSLRDGWGPNTLLVVEASRLGTAWLRPEEMWRNRLTVLGPTWGSIPFLGVVVFFGGLTSTTIRAAGIFQDGLDPAVQASLDVVLLAMGLTVNWSKSAPTVTLPNQTIP